MALPISSIPEPQATRLRTLEAWFAGQSPKTVMIGDSRAALWPKDLFKQLGHGSANLAISLTQTQDHIWQVRDTGIDLGKARTFVLVSGFNNLNRTEASPTDISEGICVLASLLKARSPNAKCCVLDIFPAAPASGPAFVSCYTDARRIEVNERLLELAPAAGFRLIQSGLTDPLDQTLYEDGVHLTRLAYERYLTPAVRGALAEFPNLAAEPVGKPSD